MTMTNGYRAPNVPPPARTPRGGSSGTPSATLLKPVGSPHGRVSAGRTLTSWLNEDGTLVTILAATIGSLIGSTIGLCLVAFLLWFVVM